MDLRPQTIRRAMLFCCADCRREVLAQKRQVPPNRCVGCSSVITSSEYAFMLHDDVWKKTKFESRLACVGCVEQRLGRRLHPKDFDWSVPMNLSDHPRSTRLRRRMKDGAARELRRIDGIRKRRQREIERFDRGSRGR